ncbi:MAG: histidine phosphatase family protein [Fibrobacter sp.]|nr:histidine phosphatase family protein [Fibrobacter sp.]
MMRKYLIGIPLLALLFACDDTGSSAVESEVMTVVRDSVVVVDSVNIIDSVVIRDSVRIKDDVRDSVRIVDSVNVIDSVRIVDSVRVVDSVAVRDSVVIVDSIAVREPEDILGKCDTSNAGAVKPAQINGEWRYFVCDELALLWRVASAVEKNDFYVTQSAVTAFTPLVDVVNGLAADEKLVLVIRHAERNSDSAATDPLNEKGMEQSLELGESLAGVTDFYCASSPSVRAQQTCNQVAKGRGDTDTLADTISLLGGYWYVKDSVAYAKAKKDNGGSWNVVTKWAYEGAYADVFYEFAPRCNEWIEDVILPSFEEAKSRVTLFVSHDLLLVPLVIYISAGNVNLRYYKSNSNRWLNYLAGVAIVMRPDGTRRFYAVRGLDSGTM